MADLESELRPLAESLMAPGEELLGACVATQQKIFKGWMVAIAVSAERIVLQKLTRKWEPDGDPLALTADRIASTKVGGGGGMSASAAGLLLDEVATLLVIETTDGEKLKLRMMHAGGGILDKASGGEIQRQGVVALGEWFDRHT